MRPDNCTMDFPLIPSWFKFEPGFKFIDPDGDEAIYLGKSGYRRIDTVATKTTTSDGEVIGRGTENVLKFSYDVDVFAYKYKNEWHLCDLQRMMAENEDYLNKCKPA